MASGKSSRASHPPRRGKGASGNGHKKPARARFTRDEQLDAYRQMLLIRRFEEKAGQLYGMGHIGGFCHLYIGQEAVVVGMQMALEPGDQVITAYRDHGHTLAVGMDPKRVMAELTGRRGGCSKGKGGSMHMFSPEQRLLRRPRHRRRRVPLGAGLRSPTSIAATAACASPTSATAPPIRARSTKPSTWRELWKLPVVFIIENNKYAMGTSIERSSSTTNLSQRGLSFAIPGEHVDGMDVEAVRAAGERAIAHARAGKGPMILEMMTYRYRGHSMSDPAKYRTREEVQHMRETHDPIEQVRARLLEDGVARGRVEGDRREVRDEVNAAAEFALADPEPDAAELTTDVWSDQRHASRAVRCRRKF